MLIPRSVFGIHKIAANQSTRYALNGVRIERSENGKAHAIATDGRRMLVYSWDESQTASLPGIEQPETVKDFGAIIPLKACKEAHRMARDSKKKPWLGTVSINEKATNGKVPISASDDDIIRNIEARCVEGKFPKWQDVANERKPQDEVRIHVDPRLLADVLATMAEFIVGDEITGVELRIARDPSNGFAQAIQIVGERDGRRAIGVVMPVNKGR